MKVSNKGLAEIASHEGIVPYPYKDSVGVWTIGVGHTANAGDPDPKRMSKGTPIPIKEVFDIFRKDISKFEARVNDAVKVPLEQYEFDALVSFDFNTGGIYRAKLTEALNEGNKSLAADRFMGWSRPPEIIPRREKEMELFRTGKYSSDGKAPVFKATSSGRVLWGSAETVDVLEVMGYSETPTTTTPETPKPTTRVPKFIKALRWLLQQFLNWRKNSSA